jgi:hypothetical protein
MVWVPSAYKSEILDFFQLGGASGVYNKATGAGFGAQWKQQVPKGQGGFLAGMNYVSQDGDNTETGVFNSNSGLNFLTQVGYRAPQWGAAVAYRYGTKGSRVRTFNALGGGSGALTSGQESNSIALNAYWQPSQSGFVPSISVGYGYNDVDGKGSKTGATDSDSWYVGLQWSDVFAQGNTAGVAIGQPGNSENISEDATMLEVFYKFQVTDNISITPALFYVSNNQRFQNESSVGGVVQTKFTF